MADMRDDNAQDATELMEKIRTYQPVIWHNPHQVSWSVSHHDVPATREEIDDTRRRFTRWQPVLNELFPREFSPAAPGVIESPLRELREAADHLARRYSRAGSVAPRIFMKLDSHLPVSGSIKARGGFHEVLALTERLAAPDTPPPDEQNRHHRGRGYSIAVGSTGNLGLSIGILGSALGYSVTVHMSADAREWKKQLLRRRGVTVVEHEGDFSTAVAAGRATAAGDPRCHFVDDEHSRDLFLGYAAAAAPLREQLEHAGVLVDRDHPLCVYLPCGVGGGPGGVTFGLKEEFGDAVHCYFVEPTHAPAMLLGLMTGRMDRVSVQEMGLDNRTIADGLAVGRPSGLVAPAMRRVVSGVFTVPDEELLALTAILDHTEGLRLEPSAVAGLPGPFRISAPPEATHLVWATGGNMVPAQDMEEWLQAGRRILGGQAPDWQAPDWQASP